MKLSCQRIINRSKNSWVTAAQISAKGLGRTLALVTCLMLTSCGGETQRDSFNLRDAAQINLQLGQVYLAQGKLTEAKSKFNKALDLAPQLPECQLNYACFLETVGEIELAERYYKAAIKLAQHDHGGAYGKALNSYAVFLCHQQNYQLALKKFLQACKDPYYLHTGEAYENAGLCALQLHDRQLARKYFTQALQNQPKLPQSAAYLAKMETDQL